MDIRVLVRPLILVGALLLIFGAALALSGRLPFLDRLPGDLGSHRSGIIIFFPVVTILLVKVTLTILINLYFRFFRR